MLAFEATALAAQTALVRHAPTLNGAVEGSIQQMIAENVMLNGGASVTGDLLVPGTPTVQLNGNPTYGGTLDGTGSATPTTYTIKLNGSASLGHVVRRANAVALPVVTAPPLPAGTRSVALNNASESPGDFATLKDLTLNSNVGQIAVPPGTYGNFNANSGSGFTLGVAGATSPVIYNFQSLALNSNSTFTVIGRVVVTLNGGIAINASMGSADHPGWLKLRLAGGDVTVNGKSAVYAQVEVPIGTLTINGASQVIGTVAADRLVLNGNALLRLIEIPVLVAVGGDNQFALVNEFNAEPFDIGVWNSAHSAPLVNRPVTFTVKSGGGQLAATNTGSPQLASSLILRTDQDGTVQAYYKHAGTPETLSLIHAESGDGEVLALGTRSVAPGDADGDGLSNLLEHQIGTNPNNPDSDGDGLPDGWEHNHGLNPLVNDATADDDGDGLTNAQEYAAGTNPHLADTDGDGIPDGWEIAHGLNPLVNDAAEDPDGDGVTNLAEYHAGTDPKDYYNGVLPQLTSTVGSDGALAPDGSIGITVRDAAGRALLNAPVSFRVKLGDHHLSAAPGGPPVDQLTVRTDANGLAKVYILGGTQ